MKRRIESFALVAALMAAALTAVAPDVDAAGVAACTTEVVRSKAGPVCGTIETTASGRQAKAFLGIPYAESTARDRRWQPPLAKRPWTKTLAAVRYGAICPQPVPPQKSAATQAPPQSEDCLSLNVWTPAGARPDARLPVMVFVHGGAFVAGSSADPLYDGAHLAANRDVVLVSFNYRLGVLGFLAADGLSGNYGFMDQQLALSWVRENIRDFGGDPDRVTLFGESAGAMSVGLHLFSAPGSAKLFRAAIMESNFLALPYKRLEDQINVGNIFKQGLNCRDVQCLRKTGVDDLLLAQSTFTPRMSTVFSGAKYYTPFAPAIDGALLTRQPVAAAADGTAGKPMLIGTNKDEATLFVAGRSITPADYAAWAAALFGKAFEQVVARYPVQQAGDSGTVWARVQTDDFLLCSTRHVATHARDAAYVYLFDHEPSFPVWGGSTCREDDRVCHGSELPFVFHSAAKIQGRFTVEEERLSNRVMDYWTNFARDLDPNGNTAAAGTLVYWPRFDAQARNYLVLNVPESSVQVDPYRSVCEFWDGMGYDLTEPWREKRDAR